MAYVHKLCQHDWLKQHCYEVPTNLPFFAGITLKVMGYGLNPRQDLSIGHIMDVYHVLLLLVSLDDMCNPFITELAY